MPTLPEAADGFEWREVSWGAALRCEPLARGADHLFTTRPLALPADPAAWASLAEALGLPTSALVRLQQVHGADVFIRRRGDVRAPDTPCADIVISDDPELVLVVQAADCVPLLLADRQGRAVAAAHAGWRGAAAGVPAVAVHALAGAFGVPASDLVAAIGPSIGPCCYQVGPEVRAAFLAAGHAPAAVARWFVSRGAAGSPAPGLHAQPDGPDRWQLDLQRAVFDQLVATGVPAAAVHTAGLCTAHHDRWLCSYRRDGAAAGRMAGAIRAGRTRGA
ncbi:MAG: peptidoglycan editing factor PgeF [Acidobacteriota bacterium]|nr:peptidoglycan editing factor PgeF [Acidobacteriota bacterium]